MGKGLKNMRWMVLVCALSALAYTPKPWQAPLEYLASFCCACSYFTGLWLANSYTADWLDRHVKWKERPLRSQLLTFSVLLTVSLLIILLVHSTFAVLFWHQSIKYVLRSSLTGEIFFPLLGAGIILLFMQGRAFLLAWHQTIENPNVFRDASKAR